MGPLSSSSVVVSYATSPQGADHTAGLTIRAKVDHLDPSIQVELSRTTQYNMAGYDSLGACIMGGFGFALEPHIIPDLIRAKYGWDVPPDFLKQLGRETILMEREFNKRAGLTAPDRIPEWMSREALPPNGSTFDVSEEELDTIFD